MAVIRVFLLDDHEMVRRGVADLIGSEDDIEVVGDAGDAAGALRLVAELQPDVAVLDISLGDDADDDRNGIDVCRAITEEHPDVACLMLTSVLDERALLAAEEAGAAGYALKSVGTSDLVDSVRSVAGGARLLDSVTVRQAQRTLEERGDGLVDTLTPQERRIFDLIGDGRSNRQIANDMYLAEKTVKNYVSNVLTKLGVDRRTEVAAMAARLNERESGWRG